MKMKQVSANILLSPFKHDGCNSLHTEITLEQLASTQPDPARDRRLATFVKVSNDHYLGDESYAWDFRHQNGNDNFPSSVLRNLKLGALWKLTRRVL